MVIKPDRTSPVGVYQFIQLNCYIKIGTFSQFRVMFRVALYRAKSRMRFPGRRFSTTFPWNLARATFESRPEIKSQMIVGRRPLYSAIYPLGNTLANTAVRLCMGRVVQKRANKSNSSWPDEDFLSPS